jgi:hypothetical protein
MGILGEIPRAEMIKNYRVKWLNGRPQILPRQLYIILQ